MKYKKVFIVLGIVILILISFFIFEGNRNKEKPVYQVGMCQNVMTIIPKADTIEETVEVDKVREYIKSYGGRINDEYLSSLRQYCDEETLKLVVAISVAETQMGKATNNYSNFYGYFYGGNRNYDPSYDEMSRVICRGISKYYPDVATNRSKAIKYTNNDNVDMWIKNVDNALSKMQ